MPFQVQCVKDMTTLSGLTDDDWTWKCDMDIREFFHEPSIPVLCIYHVNGHLTTEFSFPTVPVHELTYFVRQPNEIFYSENFRERILFGSVNDKVESHILGIIQNMFAPIFFAIETWPDSILLPSLLSHCRQSTQLIRLRNAKSFVRYWAKRYESVEWMSLTIYNDRPTGRVGEVSSFFRFSFSFFFRFISVNNVRVQIASYGTLIGSRHDIPSVFSATPRVTHLRLGFAV